MEIIWNLENQAAEKSSVVTLGTFDGVHIGHQAIIREVNERAIKRNAVSTLVTFEPHPQIVVRKTNRPPVRLLTTIDERIEVLSNTGLQRLVVINFSPQFASLTPDMFVKDVLLSKLNMKEIIIGYDHAFGKNRSGDYNLLKKMGSELGFNVDTLAPIKNSDDTVSSTRIRNMLLEGNVLSANKLLGYPYSLRGKVVEGHGRGRRLGYPTANIEPVSEYKLLPKVGIYATKVKIADTCYDSVTYIGTRATFNLSEKVIETYILDFNDQLYEREVELSFLQFIRDDAKFQSSEELISQINKDLKKSRELLTKF